MAAEITSTKGDQVTVKIPSGEVITFKLPQNKLNLSIQKTIKKELIQEMNPPKFEKTVCL